MTNEIKVALAVLFAALALYVGVRFLSGQPLFGAGYGVVVAFDDAQGLAAGSAVRLNGVRVGEVEAVTLGPAAREVFVLLQIESGVEIPRGSTFQTSGISALGEVNVEITPPAGAGAGRPIAAGDTVRAATTPDIFDLIAGESNALTARADTALIAAVNTFTQLDQILTNSGGDLQAVLAQLRFLTQAATQTIIDERARIDRTLGSLEAAAATASLTAETVGEDVREVSVVVGNDVVATSGVIRGLAETNADSVTAAVNNLSAALRQVDQTLASLDSLTVNLAALSADLDTALTTDQGTLGLLLNDPSLYYNANAAAASLQQILQDFQADPSRYLRDLDIVRVF